MTTTHLHSTSIDEAAPAFSVAIAIYTDAAKDLAAAYRGLLTAKEFAEAGDRVTIIDDGSGVLEPLGDGDWSLLEEYKGHASLRHLMAEGYQVLAF